jgi:hypothetical protein
MFSSLDLPPGSNQGIMNFLWVCLIAHCITPSLAGVSSPKRNSGLPTVDLGYEIHQATFNVRGSRRCECTS